MSTAKHVSITPERNQGLMRSIKRFLHYRAFRTTFVTMLRVPIVDLYHPAPRYADKSNFYPAVAHFQDVKARNLNIR